MKVKTQSEKIEKDRQMVMEYLLIHHPLDCPDLYWCEGQVVAVAQVPL